MKVNRDLNDIEEIGNLATFTPAEGLARLRSAAAKPSWSRPFRLRPSTAVGFSCNSCARCRSGFSRSARQARRSHSARGRSGGREPNHFSSVDARYYQ
jgi:hypothetical protein